MCFTQSREQRKTLTYKSNTQFIFTDLLCFVLACAWTVSFWTISMPQRQHKSRKKESVQSEYRQLISQNCWRGVKIIIRRESERGRDGEEEWLEWQLKPHDYAMNDCGEGDMKVILTGTVCSHMRCRGGWVGFCYACRSTAEKADGACSLSLSDVVL